MLDAESARYDMEYRRTGRQRPELPAVSLGLWHNFGDVDSPETRRTIAPPRLRSRHHALRPGQQLWAAAGFRRGEFRRADARVISSRSATRW